MLATAVIAVLVGAWICTATIRAIAHRCNLPIHETLMWLGLAELDGPALARACEREEQLEDARLGAAPRRSPAGRQTAYPGQRPARPTRP